MKQIIAIIILIITIVLTVTYVGPDFSQALPIDGGGLLILVGVLAFWPSPHQRAQRKQKKAQAQNIDSESGMRSLFKSALPAPSHLRVAQQTHPALRSGVTLQEVSAQTSTKSVKSGVPSLPAPAASHSSPPQIPTMHLGTGISGETILLPIPSTLTSGLIIELLDGDLPLASRLFAEQWGKASVPLLLVDMTGGSYSNLPSLFPGGYLFGCDGGQNFLPKAAHQARYQAANPQNAHDLGKLLVEKRLQAVFSLASYLLAAPSTVQDPASLAGKILMDILDGMREWEEEQAQAGEELVHCVVMVINAHTLLPQRDADGFFSDKAVVKALRSQLLEIQSEAGAFGIWLYLVAPEISMMHALAPQQSVLWVVNRYPREEDLQQISALTWLDLKHFVQKAEADAFIVIHGSAWAGQIVLFRQTRSQHIPMAMPDPRKRITSSNPEATRVTLPTHGAPVNNDDASHRQTGTVVSAANTTTETFSVELGAFACYLFVEDQLDPQLLQDPTEDLFPLLYALELLPDGEFAQNFLSEKRAYSLCATVQGLDTERMQKYANYARGQLAAYQQRIKASKRETAQSITGTGSQSGVHREAAQSITGTGSRPGVHEEPASSAKSPSGPLRWRYPTLALLAGAASKSPTLKDDLRRTARRIEETLKGYKVYVRVLLDETTVGPSVTTFAVELTGKAQMVPNGSGKMIPATSPDGEPLYEEGKRSTVAQLRQRGQELALALRTGDIRMAPVRNTGYIGLEVPNQHRVNVQLIEIMGNDAYKAIQAKSKLTIALGISTDGQPRAYDFRKAPHALVAGTTGGGKSTFLESLICSILYNAAPDEVQFLMVDPKGVEFTAYTALPHLREPIVTDPDLAADLFERLVNEMEARYALFKRISKRYKRQIKNITDFYLFQKDAKDTDDSDLKLSLPYIILIVDELADLMATTADDVEKSIARLGQMARAAGIHLVLATQRPSVQVVTGDIKANIATRVAFKLPSNQDSRTILDAAGAERLLGNGDMLFKQDASMDRIQAPLVDEGERDRLIQHWCKQAKMLPKATIQPQVDKEREPVPGNAQQLEIEAGSPEVNGPSKETIRLSEDENTLVRELQWLLAIAREGLKASTSLIQRRGLYGGYPKAGKTVDRFYALGVVSAPDPTTKFRDIYQDKIIELLRQYGIEDEGTEEDEEFEGEDEEDEEFEDEEFEDEDEEDEEFEDESESSSAQ